MRLQRHRQTDRDQSMWNKRATKGRLPRFWTLTSGIASERPRRNAGGGRDLRDLPVAAIAVVDKLNLAAVSPEGAIATVARQPNCTRRVLTHNARKRSTGLLLLALGHHASGDHRSRGAEAVMDVAQFHTVSRLDGHVVVAVRVGADDDL